MPLRSLNRKYAARAVSEYRRHISKSLDSHACYYCGLPANTVDHTIPISMVQQLSNIWKFSHKIWVPACQECNTLLGERPIFGLIKRRTYIKKQLRIRYRSFLKMPYWSLDELEQLGPILRQEVECAMNNKVIARKRLAWPNTGVRES